MRFIEELKTRPDKVKENYALAGAVVVTGVAALIWVLITSYQFSDRFTLQPETQQNTPDAPIFAGFWRETKQQFAAVADSFSNFTREITPSSEPATPATSSLPSINQLLKFSSSTEAAEEPVSNVVNERVVLIATTTSMASTTP